MSKEEALKLLAQVTSAVVETVNEAGPSGAPAGPMYLAFMQWGMSLATFEAVTGALVDTGKIKRRGDVFYPVDGSIARPKQPMSGRKAKLEAERSAFIGKVVP